MNEDEQQHHADLMRQGIALLVECIEWTHQRQVFVSVEDGSYVTQRAACHVRTLLTQKLNGEGQVRTACTHVCVDKTVLGMCLQEGLSNCLKYREGGTPLMVTATLEPQGTARAAGEADERTSRTAASLRLHVALDNINRAGVAPLSEEQCARVFEAGYVPKDASVDFEIYKTSAGVAHPAHTGQWPPQKSAKFA